MRIAITGEKGFIAQNLIEEINKNNTFVSLLDNPILVNKTDKGEPCVFLNDTNSWKSALYDLKVDVVIHNAAVVGTDVVALRPREAVNTNIVGTQQIISACNDLNILNTYIGTTVIYDTYKYQNSLIKEDSDIFPRTDYAIQKYAGEMSVRNNSKEWLVIRPLFAYGGIGDPNSLIAKTFYAFKNKTKIPMFLDPTKMKDYMHVSDFCNAVVNTIESDVRNDDFNVSIQNPMSTNEIIKVMSEVAGEDLFRILEWKPETDYLGNHLLSNEKFVSRIGFTNDIVDIHLGSKFVWDNINSYAGNEYDPLKYLTEAKSKNINLTEYFPKLK